MKRWEKVYGYYIAVQVLALLGYMQLHVGEPKGEMYWIGFLIIVFNGFLSFCSASPDNSIKRWQNEKEKSDH